MNNSHEKLVSTQHNLT